MNHSDQIWSLSASLSGCTENPGILISRFLESGALDAYLSGAPFPRLYVLCREERKDALISLLASETGKSVYAQRHSRFILERSFDTLSTPYGPVRRKTASGYGVCRSKAEFEDLKSICEEARVSLPELRKLLAETDAEK